MLRALSALVLLTLILTSFVGCEESELQPTPTPTALPCLADFSAKPTTGAGTTTVHFDSGNSTGEITSWAWDFGDGGNSTDGNPDHKYIRNGNYTISLTITTADCQDTETKEGYIYISGCKT